MADSVAEHITALNDEDWGVREDAATALGTFRDARSVVPLIRALTDSDRAVRTAATVALTAIGEPAIVPLGHCLQNSDLTLQEAAAAILVTIADHRVVDPLRTALLSPDWIVRMHAAEALGHIQDPQAIEAIDTLILLLQDTVPAVRDAATAAITLFGESALPQLLEGLKHKDWRTRLRAVEALALLKPKVAVEPLLALMREDPDTAVRQDAVRALGEIADPQAVAPLLEVLNQKTLKTQAIEALGKIGDP